MIMEHLKSTKVKFNNVLKNVLVICLCACILVCGLAPRYNAHALVAVDDAALIVAGLTVVLVSYGMSNNTALSFAQYLQQSVVSLSGYVSYFTSTIKDYFLGQASLADLIAIYATLGLNNASVVSFLNGSNSVGYLNNKTSDYSSYLIYNNPTYGNYFNASATLDLPDNYSLIYSAIATVKALSDAFSLAPYYVSTPNNSGVSISVSIVDPDDVVINSSTSGYVDNNHNYTTIINPSTPNSLDSSILDSINTHILNAHNNATNISTIAANINSHIGDAISSIQAAKSYAANASLIAQEVSMKVASLNYNIFSSASTSFNVPTSGIGVLDDTNSPAIVPPGLCTYDNGQFSIDYTVLGSMTASDVIGSSIPSDTPSTEGYTGLLGTIIGWLSDIWNRIGDVIGQIPSSIGNLFTNISTLVSNSVGMITGWLNDILNRIGDVVTSIPSSLSNFLTNLTSLINTSVGTIVGAIKGTFESTIEPFKPYITGVFDLVSGYALYNGVFNHFLPQPVALFLWVAWETSILVLIIRMIINRN